ncbi:copper amine oxidase N-terminal domain-containing protein [Paenibacillus alvei]|uniref:copper amine oxidase N-terminal domain-containing protein n=1 Tax=Paenibacillus alvei TaxID=44250 RepID=UPI001F505B17|nr:copper amine oxidase N-terminal domain-containing protein [Paenibacillus alvei]MCY9579546.1 copper amine oxidase N-terminal domain-containing protein [Paenibacillus alvei]MCY9586506.1 copper amine oxidase N-terminal domain-containing protein [Paenibacillus alvei]
MGKVEKAIIELNGKKVCEGTFANGLVTAPVRVIAEALGAELVWDNATKTATVNGKKIVGVQVINERAIAPVREVAEAAGYRVTGWDGVQRKVTIQN